MAKKKELLILIFILLIAVFLRLFNLMHDEPYFFNPDEKNMAIAITRFRLPRDLTKIPSCFLGGSTSKEVEPLKEDRPQQDTCNLNPHFFAYGQFPLYLSYASDQVTKLLAKEILFFSPTINNQQLTINNYLSTDLSSAIFYLRFWSALSSTAIVLLVFLISRQFLTFNFSLLTATLTAFTPGLIQAAHFGTTESLLTFFFMASIYLSIKGLTLFKAKPYQKFIIHNSFFLILNSVVIGLALGSKLTGIFFFIPPLLALILSRLNLVIRGSTSLILIIGSLFFAIFSSPYNLIEFQNFKSAVFGYEADVATGKYEAFYTRQFVDTTPILFQMEKIFPYALGWPIFILGTVGFLFTTTQLISHQLLFIVHKIQNSEFRIQNKKYKIINSKLKFLILNSAFLIYLLPHAFIFAKWTRFMTPILPFFSIFAVFGIQQIYQVTKNLILKSQKSRQRRGSPKAAKVKSQKYNKRLNLLNLKLLLLIFYFGLLTISVLPGIAFMSIYINEDSRVTASRWIYQNIPDNSYILSETANVVDIPLAISNRAIEQSSNYKVISFDFYHMDEHSSLFQELLTHLEKADYIFIPSRRIFTNHPRFPEKYPLVARYYQLLFSGRLGFEKVAEISSFPSLTLNPLRFNFPDEQSEETSTVFDHPVIRIYRKVVPLTEEKYRSMFKG